jgi:uncharacterized membrane protein
MSYKTFRMIQAFFGMALGGIMGASIAMSNWIIPVVAVVISLVVMMVLRKRIREIVADERTYNIAGKASRLTLQIFAVGMALAGVILLAVSRDSSSTIGQIAVTLCFATCALLVINALVYTYYNRKHGG